MAKNILAQEKLNAKVFSSPINRYPLFSVPAKGKVHTATQSLASGEEDGGRQRPHMSGPWQTREAGVTECQILVP